MAKQDPSGIVVKGPTSGPPGKVRRFPWRLWLWAILMTAAAGAGGYFTWHFKNLSDTAVANESETLKKFDDKEKAVGACTKSLTDKTTEATTCLTKRDELDKISKILLERETIDAEQFVALLEGKPEDEVFVDEEEPAKPVEPAPEPERPQREGARPIPRPRPGYAGGDAS